MSFVDDFLATPIPDELWHYTDIRGFEGMLKSGTIWATDARHTKDATEFNHARDLGLRFLREHAADDTANEAGRRAATEMIEKQFERGWLSPTKIEVFLASFSSARDLKSQWTGYADRDRGVSVAFDLRHIRPAPELGYAVTIAPCLYVEREKLELINGAVSRLREAVARLYGQYGDLDWMQARMIEWRKENATPDEVLNRTSFLQHLEDSLVKTMHPIVVNCTYDLLRVASHCKHEAFFQESEWRLALPHTIGRPFVHTSLQFRGEKKDIPYVAHRIGGQTKLPIVRVMTGPSCESVPHVAELLSRYQYDVPIEASKIPMRR